MGSIRLLPDILASQVAAGEVVERPASVVKELVENSIDAGARRITVEFREGGARLIRITDDGCGMDRSDALMCLERHATSKIRESSDLASIVTMGFRGEALPSIASVSRFRLTTRPREGGGGDPGTQIRVEGGVVRSVTDSGEAPGTCVEVADLFFNVPARRKFLRGLQTEAAALLRQLEPLVVARPDIAFTCIRDGRELFRLPAAEDLAVRLRDLHGGEYLARMVPVPPTMHAGIAVTGWIGAPGEGRSDRSHQLTFVNGRIVSSPVLSMPLREACDGLLPKGLHPPAVLFFTVDPSAVDCNVHPAKREVRFRDPAVIREASLLAARTAWRRTAPSPESSRPDALDHALGGLPGPGNDPLFPPIMPRIMPSGPRGYALQGELPVARVAEAPEGSAPASPNTSSSRGGEGERPAALFLGSLAGRYLLFEQEEALLLLEIRAARERIYYERNLARLSSGELESQQLLLPEILEVSPVDLAWITGHREILKVAGLSAEAFGSGSLKVDALPAGACDRPVREIIDHVLAELGSLPELETPLLGTSAREALAASIGRLAAAGAPHPAGERAARMLLEDLLCCRMPYATPTGRPTLSQISPGELAKRFRA